MGVAGVDGRAFLFGLFSYEQPPAIDDDRFDVRKRWLARHQGNGRGEDLPLCRRAGLGKAIAISMPIQSVCIRTSLGCVCGF